MQRQTYFAKKGDITPEWHHVDAEGLILGRLATKIAVVLMGKHRPEFTPHTDCGDYVIVTNAEKVAMTGNKMQQRVKKRFSGYPGGLRVETFETVAARHPERLIEDAVRRMLPKGPLGRRMYKKLKVYAGPEHPHKAQKIKPLSL